MTRTIPSDDFDAALTSILSQEAAMHEAPKFDPFAIADEAGRSRRGPVIGGAVAVLAAAAVTAGLVLTSGGSSTASPASMFPPGTVTFEYSVPKGTTAAQLDNVVSVLQRRTSGLSASGLGIGEQLGATVRINDGKVLLTGPSQYAARLQAQAAPGQLSIRQVAEQRTTGPAPAPPTPPASKPSTSTEFQAAPDAWTINLYDTVDCAHPPTWLGSVSPYDFAVGCDKDGKTAYLLHPVDPPINGAVGLGTAEGSTGPWSVYAILPDPKPYDTLLNQLAKQPGSLFASGIDGVVYSTSTANGPAIIPRRDATGWVPVLSTTDRTSAQDVTAILGAGPLPVPLQLVMTVGLDPTPRP